MNSQFQSALQKAASSTFEELGFVVPESELSDDQALAELEWSGRVSFRGPVLGHIWVRISDDVLGELAANMMGFTNDVDDSIKADALGEIANVVCGNLVPKLAGPEAVFDLEAPSLARGDSAGDGEEVMAQLTLGIDDGRAEVALVLDDASPTNTI